MKWITARHLETWAGTTQGPSSLPGLVGALIRGTVSDIGHYRFPEGDKGRVRGFDGVVETAVTSPFVPDGRSIWEFGAEKAISTKARKDFETRSKEIDEDKRRTMTFVFVTPQTWDTPTVKLHDFVDALKAEYVWKDVRLIDGVQLETWLEERPAVASKWARQVIGNYPKDGALSTDEYWEFYSRRFDPPLTEDVVLAGRERAAETLIQALLGGPSRNPLIADSPSEVIAFAVAAIRRSADDKRQYLEARTLVPRTDEAARQLLGYKDLVFLPTEAAMPMSGALASAGPTVIALGQDQPGRREAVLPRPTVQEMATALKTMGFEGQQGRDLARTISRSVTILARHKPSENIEPPRWAQKGRELLPAMLAGSWNTDQESDRDRLGDLNEPGSYIDLMRTLQPLLAEQDPFIEREHPIWLTRAPVDAFVQLGKWLTQDDLERFEKVATAVFSEVVAPSDEAFAPVEDGYSHSRFLRKGLAQTLLQIALLHEEAHLDVPHKTPQAYVDDLIANLPGLKADASLMASLRDELIVLAEAAPDPFLEALEHLLEGEQPKALALFAESGDTFGRSGAYTNVLWALEALAWSPDLFARVALALVRLAEIDPGGRYANRPKSTLRSIFLLWNPGTNASWDDRRDVLEVLLATSPKVGWQLLLDILPGRQDTSLATVRPRLRDGGGDREAMTRGLLAQCTRYVTATLIDQAGASAERWVTLIRRLVDLPPDHRALAFERLDTVRTTMSAEDRTEVWHALRKELKRHEAFASTAWAIPADELRAYQAVTNRFGTDDLVVTTRTLFTDMPMAMRDYEQAMADLKAQRHKALAALHETLGAAGVLSVVRGAPETGYDVAIAITDILKDPQDVFALFHTALKDPDLLTFARMLSGVSYHQFRDQPESQAAWKEVILQVQAAGATPEAVADLCLHWPDTPETWAFVGELGDDVAIAYWRNKPGLRLAAGDVLEGALFYLVVGRASAALRAAYDQWDEFPTTVLLRMLEALVSEVNAGRVQADTMTAFYVEGALAALDARPDASVDVIAAREFALLPLIEHGERSLSIYRYMADSPEFFFHLIKTVFRAEGEAPAENASEAEISSATQSFRLLMNFDTLPGATDDGVDSDVLSAWVDTVRDLGRENGRAPITDQYVGHALAHSTQVDPFWPGPVVAAEIERVKSEDVETGVRIERFNKRGVTTRGMDDGGQQERDLADKYAAWAAAAKPWPRTQKLLKAMEATWRHDAEREDREVRLRNARDV